jgi:hypothetical protein
MDHELRAWGTSPAAAVKIADDEYAAIRAASDGLIEIIGLEEKFDVLMENYAELESTFFDIKLRHLTFSPQDSTDLRELPRLIGRRLLNVLASGRLYRDALFQHAGRAFRSKKDDLEKLTIELAKIKQQFAYLVMEGLRDYAQHRDLTVHMLTIGSAWEGDDSCASIAYSLTPKFNPKLLLADRKCSSALKSKLKDMHDPVEMTPLIREYVEMLGLLHLEFRKLATPHEGAWASTIQNAFKRCQSPAHRKPLGIVVRATGDHLGKTEEHEFAADALECRAYLKRKNRSTLNLSKRYVRW